MADVVLSAELQARVDQFVANLLNAANSADNTSNSVSQMSSNISRNIANVNRQNLNQFTAALNAGTLSVQRFNNTPVNPRPTIVGANQAANALTNLGRVAQDAPFGFIGIQNNLNPLLESFQRLRAETGSNSAAFRALGQSLIGPAGLGIALSVVGSAILFYQQYQQRANKAANEAKKVTDDYIKSLDTLTAVNLKGAENAQKELTTLKLVYDAYQNANLPLKVRKEAYSELQSQYPDYFKNIKFEQEASEKTANAYKLLTQEILATARARAASDRITQNETRKLENEQKTTDLQQQQIKNQDELRKATERANSQNLSGSSTGGVSTNISDLTRVSKIQNKINENLNLRRNLTTDTNKLDEQNAKLVTYVNTQLEKGGKLLDSNTAKAKEASTIKAPELTIPENSSQVFTELFKKISSVNAPGALTVKAPEKIKIDASRSEIELQSFDPEKLKKEIERLKILSSVQKIGEDAQKGIQDLFSIPNTVGLVSDAIGKSFEAMGAAIASGGDALAAAGKVLQSLVGGIMAALGQQLITLGTAKVAAGILATPFGGKLVAEGAGLIAIGAGLALAGGVVKNLGSNQGGSYENVKQVRGFATGGSNLSPGLALVGERGPELVNLPTGATVYNNNRSMDMLSGMGGGSVIINGNFDIGLEKLYVRLEQVGKKMGRKS